MFYALVALPLPRLPNPIRMSSSAAFNTSTRHNRQQPHPYFTATFHRHYNGYPATPEPLGVDSRIRDLRLPPITLGRPLAILGALHSAPLGLTVGPAPPPRVRCIASPPRAQDAPSGALACAKRGWHRTPPRRRPALRAPRNVLCARNAPSPSGRTRAAAGGLSDGDGDGSAPRLRKLPVHSIRSSSASVRSRCMPVGRASLGVVLGCEAALAARLGRSYSHIPLRACTPPLAGAAFYVILRPGRRLALGQHRS